MCPFVVDACPGVGKHTMISKGWGKLIKVYPNGDKKTIFSGGTCWQCKHCKEVLVTEYDPLFWGIAGHYAMRNPGRILGNYGYVMEATPNIIGYTDGASIPYCFLYFNN